MYESKLELYNLSWAASEAEKEGIVNLFVFCHNTVEKPIVSD
jgi:hypothetical protein